jgi:dihydroxyacid dehydratase/phosphogluconate dehydratase
MDAKLNLQAKLPSRHVTDGRDRPAEIIKRTWCIADLKSTGRYVAKDLLEAGGVPLLMRTLLDHGTGRVVAENLKRVKRNKDQSVVHPADKPLSAQPRAAWRDSKGCRVGGLAIYRLGALL